MPASKDIEAYLKKRRENAKAGPLGDRIGATSGLTNRFGLVAPAPSAQNLDIALPGTPQAEQRYMDRLSRTGFQPGGQVPAAPLVSSPEQATNQASRKYIDAEVTRLRNKLGLPAGTRAPAITATGLDEAKRADILELNRLEQEYQRISTDPLGAQRKVSDAIIGTIDNAIKTATTTGLAIARTTPGGQLAYMGASGRGLGESGSRGVIQDIKDFDAKVEEFKKKNGRAPTWSERIELARATQTARKYVYGALDVALDVALPADLGAGTVLRSTARGIGRGLGVAGRAGGEAAQQAASTGARRVAPILAEESGRLRVPSPFESQLDDAIDAAGGQLRTTQRGAGRVYSAEIPESLSYDTVGNIARQTVTNDRAGAVSRMFDNVPGVKWVRSWEKPALSMDDDLLVANVGRQQTKAALETIQASTANRLIREGDELFGKGATDGSVTSVRFIGDEAKRVPWVGQLGDIIERPGLYDLSAEQADWVARLGARNDGMAELLNSRFGTKIGRFVNPEGQFLPNIDVSDEAQAALDALGGAGYGALRSARSKPRAYANAAQRWMADNTFVPELNVRRLLAIMDSHKADAASSEFFRRQLGGLTKLEVIAETHPKLFQRMTGLRNRLQSLQGALERLESKAAGAIDDFLNSSMDDAALEELARGVDVKIGADIAGRMGPNFGMTPAQLRADIKSVKAAIKELRPFWNSARPKGYTLVTEGGINRYFPNAKATQVRELLENTANPAVNAIGRLTNTYLGGDLSPVLGVQTPLAFVTNPIGMTRRWVAGAAEGLAQGDLFRGFRAADLADDIAANPQSWSDFAVHTGIPVKPGVPSEFAGSLLESSKLPFKLGAKYARFNDGLSVGLLRTVKHQWDDLVDKAVKNLNVSRDQAMVIASDSLTKAIPMTTSARMGQSVARAAVLRAPFTSYSFLRKPIELANDVASAFVKIGLRKPLTAREHMSLIIARSAAATTMTVSVSSAVLEAWRNGEDMVDAAVGATNPADHRFMAIVFPGGSTIPLGGPFRSLIRAMWPREVGDSGTYVPFAGVPNWIRGKVAPSITTLAELTANSDYFGEPIMHGAWLEKLAQGTLYAIEGIAPLTLGEVSEGIRKGRPAREIFQESAAQFVGTPLRYETIYQTRNKTVEKFARETGITGYGGKKITTHADLPPAYRRKFAEAYPEIAAEIEAEIIRAAKNGNESAMRQVRAKELVDNAFKDQQSDDAKLLSGELAPEKWREQRSTRLNNLALSKDMLYEGVTYTKRNETVLDKYYAKIDEAKKLAGNQMNSDAWDIVEQWVASLPSSDRDFIGENTGVGEMTPVEQAYKRDVQLISKSKLPGTNLTYWDIADGIADELGLDAARKALWEEYLAAGRAKKRAMAQQDPWLSSLNSRISAAREFMRSQNPALDMAVLRWGYATSPQTDAGEALFNRLYGR